MVCTNLNGLINKADSLSLTKENGQPNRVRMNSEMNFAITIAIFVCNAFISTHLVA
jgi:hypothetical protein